MIKQLTTALLGIWILAACCNSGAAQSDHIIWFFGDSLCGNKPHAAPWYIHQKDYAMVHNHCQPGMAASQFTMPNHIFPDVIAGADVHVVIWLGTNDARTGNYSELESQYHAFLQTFTNGGAYTTGIDVLVILPPAGEHLEYYHNLLDVRSIIQGVADQYTGVTVLDMVYDWDLTTPDNLHPTQQHSKLLGNQVLDALGIPRG